METKIILTEKEKAYLDSIGADYRQYKVGNIKKWFILYPLDYKKETYLSRDGESVSFKSKTSS